jgi:hypothetical protein
MSHLNTPNLPNPLPDVEANTSVQIDTIGSPSRRDELLKKEHPQLRVISNPGEGSSTGSGQQTGYNELVKKIKAEMAAMETLLITQQSAEQDSQAIERQLTKMRLDAEKLKDNIAIHEGNLSKSLEEANHVVKTLSVNEDQKNNLEKALKLIQYLGTKLSHIDSAKLDQANLAGKDPSLKVEESVNQLASILESLGATPADKARIEGLEKVKEVASTLTSTPGDVKTTKVVEGITRVMMKYLHSARELGHDVDFKSIGVEHTPSQSPTRETHEHSKFLDSVRSYMSTLSKKEKVVDSEVADLMSAIRNVIDRKISPQGVLVRLESGENLELSTPGTKKFQRKHSITLDEEDHTQSEKSLVRFLESLQLYLGSLTSDKMEMDPRVERALNQIREAINKKIHPKEDSIPTIPAGKSSQESTPSSVKGGISASEIEGMDSEEVKIDRKYLESLQLYLGTLEEKGKPLDPVVATTLSQIRATIERQLNPESANKTLSEMSVNIPDKETLANASFGESDAAKEKSITSFLESLLLYIGSITQDRIPLDPRVERCLAKIRVAIDRRLNGSASNTPLLFARSTEAKDPVTLINPDIIEGMSPALNQTSFEKDASSFLEKLNAYQNASTSNPKVQTILEQIKGVLGKKN